MRLGDPGALLGIRPGAQRTRYFTNVLGVFQGGGVRGAALAGAYAAARARGVRFSAVAGTSAGAIVAAFVAAGATPEFLYATLTSTPFASLLQKPIDEDRIQKPSFGQRIGRYAAAPVMGWHEARAIRESGAYSANGIEEWIEQQLRKLTGLPRQVLFRDLDIPLYIIASDLRHRAVRVWKSSRHADMSVAVAARRSGSIPTFFQPSADDHGLYVDGGLLSNLPAFVYKLGEARDEIESSFTRVLAFRLRETMTERDPQSPREFIDALVDTGIEANMELQLQLQSDVHAVEIPTGTIKATDFKTITDEQRRTLWLSGAEAVNEFLDNEAIEVRSHERRDYRGYEEEMYLLTSFASEGAGEITVVGDTRFVFYATATLLHAVQDSISLRVVVPPVPALPAGATADEQRSYRTELHQRAMLRSMGAQLFEPPTVPWRGFIVRRGSRQRRAVIVDAAAGPITDFVRQPVMLYQDSTDGAVINVLEAALAPLMTAGLIAPVTPASPQWVLCAQTDWEPLLRQVPLYGNPRARLSLESIRLSDLQVLDRYVKEYRIPAARRMIEGYRARGAALFDPYFVVFVDGRRSLVTPPVFEETAVGMVALEGVTRAYLLQEEGAAEVRGIVVRNVTTPLPGTPHSLRQIRITSRTLTLDQNITNLDRSRFRYIEQDVHPYVP
jgi:predicted acylesterase/phospholipase RssA